MRKFIPLILLGSALLAGWPWIGPWLDNALFAIRLTTQPAPERIAVPVQGVARSSVNDTWGAARSGGRRHEGVDIFARRGTPVIAATEGIVSRIGENRLGGTVVWVYGPGRQRHYYAHLDRVAESLESGQRVAVGDVLGYVGNTGNARTTPPHLHYGIYTVTGAINPYPLLTGAAPKTEDHDPKAAPPRTSGAR